MNVDGNLTAKLMREITDRQEARMMCAACGELVYEGPVREGRHEMQKHREQEHPELARAAIEQKRARSTFAHAAMRADEKAADTYAKQLARQRRDARRAA